MSDRITLALVRALAAKMRKMQAEARKAGCEVDACWFCGAVWAVPDLHKATYLFNDGWGPIPLCDECKAEQDSADHHGDYGGCHDLCDRCRGEANDAEPKGDGEVK